MSYYYFIGEVLIIIGIILILSYSIIKDKKLAKDINRVDAIYHWMRVNRPSLYIMMPSILEAIEDKEYKHLKTTQDWTDFLENRYGKQ